MMTLKEFKLLGMVFIFVFAAGLIFMLDSHKEGNSNSEVVYIDEYQVVTHDDAPLPVEETDLSAEEYAERSNMEQLMEMIGFIR
ncbi:hypothetical protein ACFFLE_09520 [Salinicoccus siamensis]|uniref:Uncharacterized protein n=2 Tax=Salinicoccus siamensis TaxID=381830 RepID=A0ABV5Z5A5_9STAP